MTYGDTAVLEVVEHVRSCVCATLDETAARVDGQPGCPCRSCAMPGSVAGIQNECCGGCSGGVAGGQLSVNVARIFPSIGFPRQDPNADVCAPTIMVAELNIRLLRCIPVYDGDGPEAATCDALQAAADVANIDAISLYSAIECCVPTRPLRRKKMKTVNLGLTSITDGGCAGWDARLLVDLGRCDCEEAA